MSEPWAANHLYCPQCGSRAFRRYVNNARVADLQCPDPCCSEQYELKSSKKFGRKINDGEYATLMKRLQSVSNPNLILLTYRAETYAVDTVQIIPRFLFTPVAIEPRTPLRDSARRRGWQGCKILLDRIPLIGLVCVVQGGVFLPEAEVRSRWASLSFLQKTKPVEERTWLVSTLRVIDELGRQEFVLEDLYRREGDFSKMFPNNRHVRPKLRQQLQRLRDGGLIEFVGRGRYRRLVG